MTKLTIELELEREDVPGMTLKHLEELGHDELLDLVEKALIDGFANHHVFLQILSIHREGV